MDLSLSAAEEEFRDSLRGWIAANHPGPGREGEEDGSTGPRSRRSATSRRSVAALVFD